MHLTSNKVYNWQCTNIRTLHSWKDFFHILPYQQTKRKTRKIVYIYLLGFFYITVSVLVYLFRLFLVFDVVWWTELITCPALSTHYMFASCYISLEFPIWVSHYSLHISARLVPLMRTLERLQNTGYGHGRCVAITPVPLTEEHYPDAKHCTAAASVCSADCCRSRLLCLQQYFGDIWETRALSIIRRCDSPWNCRVQYFTHKHRVLRRAANFHRNRNFTGHCPIRP